MMERLSFLNLLACCGILLTRASVESFTINKYQADHNSLRFFVIGDWGGLPQFPYRTFIETAVAGRLAKFADSLQIHFLLALGDNFYYDGVKNLHDPRFKETYEDVFTDPGLNLPWYLIAGNHDHNGNVSAQIAYTDKVKRWNFPDFYYNLTFAIPGSDARVDVVMLDTVQLCGNVDDFVDVRQPAGPPHVGSAEKQWAWLEKQLASSRAEYLLVAGHYPVYSIAKHGPTDCLVKRLQPMLYKYKVNAYLCGHDHNIQHLEYSQRNWTVNYFISGSANFVEDNTTHRNSVPPGSSKFYWADQLSLGGFGYAEVTPQNLALTFVRSSGHVLYQKSLKPRSL